ncbi:Branched-chain amino acid aminotransferase II [Penicillium hispanicum]|uniref:Branched-chain amino acid aminotransferase II n=1 Tax=Penicillium hispanicum TaxID=1080232 RepID=UPI0025411C1F|nr:Branched-chain amino acid aminotransferase II [Penicillium hispanicum]KAJ5584747.1 Branched-chain amino acid aminotransferase II [Penicillium hispanicum]
MKAARWMGTREIEVGLVPKPTITDPSDAIVQITHCTIGGSDLHIYEGDLNDAIQKGDIMGQEAIGIVEEVGPKVRTIQPGDRVMILPVVACGRCEYCQRQQYSLCDVTNTSKETEDAYGQRLSGALGYGRLCGGYPGDQAEYCRVPHADLTCVKAPRGVDARKLLGLANVVGTAWHALELAEVHPGDIVGVWGCGPVGLSIQRLAQLRSARKIYAMDRDRARLRLAEKFGMTPVDVKEHREVGDYLLSVQPQGLDRSIEACGLGSKHNASHAAMRTIGLERESSDTVAAIMKATRKGGNIALTGDFCFTTHLPIGPIAQKALTVRGGQAWPQKVCASSVFHASSDRTQYHPFLLDLVIQGKIDPSWMFTYEDEFENIADQYRRFAQHETPGGLKVCLVTAFGRSEHT